MNRSGSVRASFDGGGKFVWLFTVLTLAAALSGWFAGALAFVACEVVAIGTLVARVSRVTVRRGLHGFVVRIERRDTA